MSNRLTPPIQSLDRGLRLLLAVAEAGRPLGLAELTDALGIDRSSVFRLANTLRLKGFLAQSPHDKSYALGPTILGLAGHMQSSHSPQQVAREHIVWLAAATHETAHLGFHQGKQVVILDSVPSDQPVNVASRCGEMIPLHCSALGKALLADYDLPHLKALLGHCKLSAETDRTVRSFGELARECDRTRRRGYAMDDEEFDEGVRCIAAAVRDGAGQIVAAIGISAPADRLPRSRVATVARSVVTAAGRISEALGYTAPGARLLAQC